MPLIKSLQSESLLVIGVWSARLIAIQMDEVPLDGDDPILSLDVATTGHSFTLKLRPSSVTIDVVIELTIIRYLNPQTALIDCMATVLANAL